MPDDRQIWQRIRHGDTHAFDEFYRQNSEPLEVCLRRMVGNRQVAEDLMQETFTQVWCRPNGFQPERGGLRAYLFGIGRKRAAEWWRAARISVLYVPKETDKDCFNGWVPMSQYLPKAPLQN